MTSDTPCEIHNLRLDNAEGEIEEHDERIRKLEVGEAVMQAAVRDVCIAQKEHTEEMRRFTTVTIKREAETSTKLDDHLKEHPRMDDKGSVAVSNGLAAPTSGPAYYLAVFLKFGGKEAVRWVGIALIFAVMFWGAPKLFELFGGFVP